jgi:hypothetical protein
MSIPGCSTEKRILRHLEDAKLIRYGLFTEADESSEPILLYGSKHSVDGIL